MTNPIIMNICNMEDIEQLKKTPTVKYLNVDISNNNREIIEYLKKYGQNFYYAERINDINGYVYVDYDTFIAGEEILTSIIKKIPHKLNDFEKVRYLYLKLGETVGYDINIIEEKNEDFTFDKINSINNLWYSLKEGKGINNSYTKALYYLLTLIGIKNEIITTNDYNYHANKIDVNNHILIVDIGKDIPFIEAKYQTRFFGNNNDLKEIDQKIGYIDECYFEDIISKNFNPLDNREETLESVLNKITKILDISQIKPIELGIILEEILKKYYSKPGISINNLYLSDIYHHKEHFLLISDQDKHYSYNYRMNAFLEMKKSDLIENININRIGIYKGEYIPNLELNIRGVK